MTKPNKYIKNLAWFTEQVEKITRKYSTQTEIVNAILALTETDKWKKLAKTEAARIVEELSATNARSWREAAKQSRKGHVITKVLSNEVKATRFQSLTHRNAELIKTIPNTTVNNLLSQIQTAMLQGERVETLLKTLPPDVSENTLRRIVRTETAKTQAAITQIRAEQVGIDYYIWRTVKDQRVRSSHHHMEGLICSYSHPPSPEALNGQVSVGYYNPGEIWNCRCYAEPVIDIDFLDPPYKIVMGNHIQRMTKRELQCLSV